MTMQSPRFYGWVIGGTQPVALAADWLVSTWDQNTVMRAVTPGVIGAEELAGEWVLSLLGLPATAAVSFVTGATMATFVGLAAARNYVLADVGWDVNRDGLSGAPRVHFLAGEERHGAVDLAARYLGLGEATLVKADAEGRIRVDLLADALADLGGPKILCLQAGNVHSGSFDDLWAAIEVGHAAGRLGARRWRVRPVGGGIPTPAAPHGGPCPRRLLGNRCAQDSQRAVRLRRRDRRASGCHDGHLWTAGRLSASS